MTRNGGAETGEVARELREGARMAERGLKEWPTEHTEYTERETRGGSRGNGKWGGVYLTTKPTKDTKGGGTGMTGKRNGDLRGCGG